jgi:hypothetical protein
MLVWGWGQAGQPAWSEGLSARLLPSSDFFLETTPAFHSLIVVPVGGAVASRRPLATCRRAMSRVTETKDSSTAPHRTAPMQDVAGSQTATCSQHARSQDPCGIGVATATVINMQSCNPPCCSNRKLSGQIRCLTITQQARHDDVLGMVGCLVVVVVVFVVAPTPNRPIGGVALSGHSSRPVSSPPPTSCPEFPFLISI